MSSFSRQSRFMRSMTPSASVKMSTSRFNLVCGKTTEQACRPNLDRIPNPQGPKIIDARVTTPTMSRREFSQTRETYGRPPVPPPRDSSLYLPFGSYAEMGVHTKAPSRYSSTSYSGGHDMRTSRRSVTPGPNMSSYRSEVSSIPSSSYSASRRNSVSLSSSNAYSASSSSRQRHYSTSSAAYGTPASSRGLAFY
eukprot:GFUD01003185.1.p1 GENE.GFUD01003185.1~~GFUD01003185.1.p1  ORF type:complete len:195 (+),score=42.87 GFUD01003185.1:239-823(+)